jgi:hypothetical protein
MSLAPAVEAAHRMSFACATCGRISSAPRCPDHQRGNPRQRGYDHHFQASRAQLLAGRPTCKLCGTRLATVAHHRPTRRRLVAMGVADPHALALLEPLCAGCHAGETVANR